VVLLHPGVGLDGSVFLPGAKRLAETHKLYLVDLPGNGHSPDGNRDAWTFSGFAAAVERFVRKRKLEDWTLLGHSFGGFVAMQYLIDFPGSVSRLIASCTDCDEEPAPGAPEDPFEGMPEEVAASVRAAFERESSVETVDDCRRVWLDQMPFFVGAPDRVETLRAAFAHVAYRVEVQREGERDWGELHALDALRASDIPVLAITGECDRAQPPANARRIAEAAPRGELVVLDGAGHFPFAEVPDAYWGTLGEWLKRTGS
jgi:pimeloyl-ACP methyl ester carboxylesterase